MLRKLLIAGFLSGIVFTGLAQEKKIFYNEIGSPLPPMRIFTYDGKYLSDKDLKNDANLVIMMFNPTCEHCEEQTAIFKDNLSRFKHTKLLLVAAAAMVPHLDYFRNVTRLKDVPIVVGVDSLDYVDKTFRYVTLPQINIYDKDRKLIKMFYGITPIDSLSQYLDKKEKTKLEKKKR